MVTAKTKNFIGAFITFVGGCGGVFLVGQGGNFSFKIIYGVLTLFCFAAFYFYVLSIIRGENKK